MEQHHQPQWPTPLSRPDSSTSSSGGSGGSNKSSLSTTAELSVHPDKAQRAQPSSSSLPAQKSFLDIGGTIPARAGTSPSTSISTLPSRTSSIEFTERRNSDTSSGSASSGSNSPSRKWQQRSRKPANMFLDLTGIAPTANRTTVDDDGVNRRDFAAKMDPANLPNPAGDTSQHGQVYPQHPPTIALPQDHEQQHNLSSQWRPENIMEGNPQQRSPLLNSSEATPHPTLGNSPILSHPPQFQSHNQTFHDSLAPRHRPPLSTKSSTESSISSVPSSVSDRWRPIGPDYPPEKFEEQLRNYQQPHAGSQNHVQYNRPVHDAIFQPHHVSDPSQKYVYPPSAPGESSTSNPVYIVPANGQQQVPSSSLSYDPYPSFHAGAEGPEGGFADTFRSEWPKYPDPTDTSRRPSLQGNSTLAYPSASMLNRNDEQAHVPPPVSPSMPDPFYYQSMRYSPALWGSPHNDNLSAANGHTIGAPSYSFDPSMSFAGMPSSGPTEDSMQARRFSEPSITQGGMYSVNHHQNPYYQQQSSPYAHMPHTQHGYPGHPVAVQPFGMRQYGMPNLHPHETSGGMPMGQEQQLSPYYQHIQPATATTAMSEIQPSALNADLSDSASATSSGPSVGRGLVRGQKRSRQTLSVKASPGSTYQSNVNGEPNAAVASGMQPPGSASSNASSYEGTPGNNLWTSPYTNLANLSKLQLDTSKAMSDAHDTGSFAYSPRSAVPLSAASTSSTFSVGLPLSGGGEGSTQLDIGETASSGEHNPSGTSGSNKKLYECRTCGRKFPRPSALIVHARIHSGEKPFVCEDCGRPFTVASNLRRHQKIHAKQMKLAAKDRPENVQAPSSSSSTVKARPSKSQKVNRPALAEGNDDNDDDVHNSGTLHDDEDEDEDEQQLGLNSDDRGDDDDPHGFFDTDRLVEGLDDPNEIGYQSSFSDATSRSIDDSASTIASVATDQSEHAEQRHAPLDAVDYKVNRKDLVNTWHQSLAANQ